MERTPVRGQECARGRGGAGWAGAGLEPAAGAAAREHARLGRATHPAPSRPLPPPSSPLELTGGVQTCLNLGSYNYLGFAAQDEYCTPRVERALDALGWGACSARADAGTTPLHRELETLVAEFLGKEDAITCGMGESERGGGGWGVGGRRRGPPSTAACMRESERAGGDGGRGRAARGGDGRARRDAQPPAPQALPPTRRSCRCWRARAA